jgi:glycolate oxidase iron-sulfur subunit
MEEAGTCCGGGGAFQFDFPGVSKGITEKKIKHIRETGAGVVVSGCPGCRLTIGGNMDEETGSPSFIPFNCSIRLFDKDYRG